MSQHKAQQEGQKKMQKTLESLRQNFAKIRTGRANPALLESVKVFCYGSNMPLKQVANVTVEEGRTLVVSPWDPKLLQDIEKALLKSDIGITPSTTSGAIRLPMPPLTEENRNQQVKAAKQEAERTRVTVRNIRRDINNSTKALIKNQELSADEEKRISNQTQKITDENIARINDLLKQKESDLLDISQ